ncbi:MAG TPA: hypothetical protein PLN13_13570 [Bacteroidia bacterium]|nr:hypothetical protein [Bacteroidia bacterium]HRH09605.1 hypothetical protein [Bacteroidia bacterium]
MAVNGTGFVNILKIVPSLVLYFSKTYRNSRKIEATWKYECILREGIFIDVYSDQIERNAHGGTCSISIDRGLMTTSITIVGERIWAANIDGDGNKKDFYNLPESRKWESNNASFITDTKIMYKYVLNDSLVGITFMDLNYDNNERKLKPIGEFYYLPANVNIANYLARYTSRFQRIFATKEEPISTIALRAFGTVKLLSN